MEISTGVLISELVVAVGLVQMLVARTDGLATSAGSNTIVPSDALGLVHRVFAISDGILRWVLAIGLLLVARTGGLATFAGSSAIVPSDALRFVLQAVVAIGFELHWVPLFEF